MIAGKALCLLIALVVLATASEHERVIIRGIVAKPDQFQHRISIRENVKGHIAGGSILSSNWVLTSASPIFRWVRSPKNLTAWAGGHFINDGVRSNVLKVVVHSGFNDTTNTNDVALLQVTPIRWVKNRVAPIRLPTAPLKDSARVWGVSNGWLRKLGGNLQPVVYMNVQTMPMRECRERAVTSLRKKLNNQHLCVLAFNDGSLRSSEGNALTLAGKPNVLVGILSITYSDALYPEVYTRVWPFVPFIRRVTGIRN